MAKTKSRTPTAETLVAGEQASIRRQNNRTPGPWKNWLNRTILGPAGDGIHDKPIAELANPGIFAASEEQAGNASLIAAAPDLLNANHVAVDMLQECADTSGCNDQIDTIYEVLRTLRAAIGKAEGWAK